MRSTTFFAKTPPIKLFLLASIPGVVSMLASALYQTFDGILVGQFLGATAFAAINLAMPFVIINFALSDLIGVGSAVPISVCLGRKQEQEANNIFSCSILMIIGTGVIMGAVLFAAAPFLIGLMGAEGEFARLAVQYLRVYALCSPFTTIVYALDNYLRISGFIRGSMGLNILMSALSVGLGLLFLGVFRWGISAGRRGMRSERIGDHPMKVITISREFGSGGRELGKRLAEQLGYAYYDREIEEHVAHRMDLDESYISRAIEQGALINVPLHFGRTLASSHMLKQQVSILVEKQRVLREIAAASNCVIVGRAADAILADQNPFRLFVYADMEHKVQRCRAYAEPGEGLSGRELEQSIRRMDAKRADYYRMFADVQWGKKENYHLCVNTTGLEIKKIVPSVAQYVTACF